LTGVNNNKNNVKIKEYNYDDINNYYTYNDKEMEIKKHNYENNYNNNYYYCNNNNNNEMDIK
jgi:hypothetical protein